MYLYEHLNDEQLAEAYEAAKLLHELEVDVSRVPHIFRSLQSEGKRRRKTVSDTYSCLVNYNRTLNSKFITEQEGREYCAALMDKRYPDGWKRNPIQYFSKDSKLGDEVDIVFYTHRSPLYVFDEPEPENSM